MAIRISIDVGGTFTDLAVINGEGGELKIFKTPTTPEDIGSGIINGFNLAADYYHLDLIQFLQLCNSKNGGAILYGTTIATNALIQKKTAKVGLICTEGHRDILTLREGDKEDPYDWDLDYPDPYVPRYLTIPIRERIGPQGEIITPLDESTVRKAIKQLLSYNIEVIAVALLWSIANPIHEIRVSEIITEISPRTPFILSHQINPIPREYRRTMSTVINASLLPIVGPYLRDFEDRLRQLGYGGQLSMISSFGGVMSLQDMEKFPIYCLDSGPTGGPIAALLYGESELNCKDVVACDMGGTSFDVSRVTDGVIGTTLDSKIGIDFLGIRKVDTRSIGAGGGSIAWVDPGGLLNVGPESAGAKPGPACYMMGGTHPTVTDASVVLGYLNPNYLLGGRVQINKKLATQAINDEIAKPLNINVIEAAYAIWSTVCMNMADAIRNITSWEGIDPREYLFVAGGGAAGTHIIPIIADMGVKHLIIPKYAGAFSAVGGLQADMVAEFQQTYETDSRKFDFVGVNAVLNMLKEKSLTFLNSNSIKSEDRELLFYVDARYYSQPWDITIPVRKGFFGSEKDLNNLVNDFHENHEKLRGSKEIGNLIECIHWRVKAIGKTRHIDFSLVKIKDKPILKNKSSGKRKAFFKELGGLVECEVHQGDRLNPGDKIPAPAIIEEIETTIVVFPGSEVAVSNYGNYTVEIQNTQ